MDIYLSSAEAARETSRTGTFAPRTTPPVRPPPITVIVLAAALAVTMLGICEVIRIIFFTCGVTKLLPILEKLDLETIDLDEA